MFLGRLLLLFLGGSVTSDSRIGSMQGRDLGKAIAGVASVASMRLPHRPELAPWTTVADLGEGRLQLRSSDLLLSLPHPLLSLTFKHMEPYLDGHHTVPEICARASGRQVESATVHVLLQLLAAKSLLIEGDFAGRLAPSLEERWAEQLSSLGRLTDEPHAVQARLLQSRVGVIGVDVMRDAIMSALRSVGIENIEGYCEVGDGSVDSLIGEATRERDGRAMDLLIVGCREATGRRVFRAINSATMNCGMRWIRVSMSALRADLGPTVVPGQTACYECYMRRELSNEQDPKNSALYFDQVLPSRRGKSAEGLFTPLLTVVANELALEVMRLLSGISPPATIGRICEFSAVHPRVVAHRLLKVPTCGACGPRLPARPLWRDEGLSADADLGFG